MTILYFLFIHFFLNLISTNLGFIFFKKKKKNLATSLLILSLGFCLITIISSYSYLVLGLNIKNTLILIFILNFLILIFNFSEYKSYFKVVLNISFINIPFIIFFGIIAIIYGEQYYSFRGNHWDYLNYVTSSFAISKYELQYIKENINYLKTTLPFSHMGWLLHIEIRPSINIFFSLFLKFGIENFYLIFFVLKIYGLFLICVSKFILLDKFFERNVSDQKKIILAYISSLSFWSIYILEIDALSQLFAQSLFILCLYCILDIEKIMMRKNIIKKLYFLIFNLAFFLIYPELFAIYLLIGFIYLILAKKLYKLINYKNSDLILFSIIFVIVSLPFFEYVHKFLYHQFFAGLQKSNLWGYFGAFVLGKENSILNAEFVDL